VVATFGSLNSGGGQQMTDVTTLFRRMLESDLAPNKIEVHAIDTNFQKADIFTKGLRKEKFQSI